MRSAFFDRVLVVRIHDELETRRRRSTSRRAPILIFDSVSGTLLTNATIFNGILLAGRRFAARPGLGARHGGADHCRFLSRCRAMTMRWISLVPS